MALAETSCSLRKLRSTGGGAGSEVQEHINSKFVLDGAFVGRFATLDVFFAGPEQLIGTPNPKIEEGSGDGALPQRQLRESLHDGQLQRDDVAEAGVGVCGGAQGGGAVPPHAE